MEFRDLKRQYQKLKPQMDAAVAEVLERGSFIGGEPVRLLEKKLADYVNVKHCIACANGTDALTLALKTWEIGPEDAVFVPDFTFFSTAECPAAEGAHVVFVDICKDTFNLDPSKLEEAVRLVQEEGRYRPRVVIAVDLFGQCAEYSEIRRICTENDLLLLEDGAQGFGGCIGQKKACSFGDISITSFFPAKPLGCCGDGGAVFTDRDDWAERIRSLAVHGKGTDKYDNVRIGMNSRLDTLQAAILQVKLEAFVSDELRKVNQAADWYKEELDGSSLECPVIKDDFYSSWAQYTVKLPPEVDRERIRKKLNERDIPSNVYYVKPLHFQNAFREMTDHWGDREFCPVTVEICSTVLSLPIHPYMERSEVRTVAIALRESM